MKQIFLLLSLVATASFSFAQQIKKLSRVEIAEAQKITNVKTEASYFEAEGKLYYQVDHAAPSAAVSFYSKPSGGRLLKIANTNAYGRLSFESAADFLPAFALCNGRVAFFSDKDFAFSNPSVEFIGATSVLHWQMIVNNDEQYSFSILKSTDGKHFTTIGSIEANSHLQDYSYADKDFSSDAIYQIQISSASKGIRYTSKSLAMEQPDAITVYPTISNNKVTIAANAELIGSKYFIMNMQGQRIAEGILTSQTTTVSTNNFASGIYTVMVLAQGKTICKRIEKV